METKVNCHGCSSPEISLFYRVENVPVQSCVLVPTREDALGYPRGDIQLGFCYSCGLISNVLFDPIKQDTSLDYEETQGCSPRFQVFARNLVDRLIERYDLRNKHVLEIGCGKGEFLNLLCQLGKNRGIGIDPIIDSRRVTDNNGARVKFIKDFFSEKYSHLAPDFVCCRHTLEHIPTTADFLRSLRRFVGNRYQTIVFFEVPDVSRILREQAFWDIYYEHCSYFSSETLGRLFQLYGFEVLDLYKGFDEQYLLIEARPSTEPKTESITTENGLKGLSWDVKVFETICRNKVEEWRQKVRSFKNHSKRVVIWGSGSKAVGFLSTIGIEKEVECVVDINPYKHHKYQAGTGHEIVPPGFLKHYQPDVVLVMNPAYCEEIKADLNCMDVSAQLQAV